MFLLSILSAFAADPFVPDADTVLLLHGDGSIVDDSASSHGITLAGQVTTSALDPLTGSGSILFDGDGDSLTIPQSADFDFGTNGDFTIETWVKPETATADTFWRRIFGFGTNDASRMHLILNATTTYGGSVGGAHMWNNAAMNVGSTDLTDGDWHHVSAVRFGRTFYLWVDGVLQDQTSPQPGVDMANAAELVVGSYTGSVNGNFHGEMDEFRVSTTARHLFPFDPHDPDAQPPSVPNFLNDANTTLVLRGDTDFLDSSPAARAVTVVGNPEFGVPGRVGSGAMRFDGDDHLVIAQSPDFDWSNSEFTVEVWTRFVTSVSDNGFWPRIWGFGTNDASGSRLQLITEIDTSYGSVPGAAHAWAGGYGNVPGSGSNGLAVGTSAMNDGDWHHVAVVGTGDDVLLFVDGVLEANAGLPTSFINDADLIIGGYGNGNAGRWIGDIDELRISSVARYTQDFDPEQIDACGDNVCDPTIGEDEVNCPMDCFETCNGQDDDFDGTIDEQDVCRCRGGSFLGSEYLACPAQTSWDNAQLACANFGYDMVEVNSAAEDAEIQRRLYRTWVPRFWWLGATDRDTEGTFEWFSGAPMNFTLWTPGQPDDFGAEGQDCLGLFPQVGTWFDVRCERQMSFICERPL